MTAAIEVFGEDYPITASTLVGVATLWQPDVLVEIDALGDGVSGRDRAPTPTDVPAVVDGDGRRRAHLVPASRPARSRSC